MKKAIFTLLALLSGSNVLAQDLSLEESAINWYRDQYAPVWVSAEDVDPAVAASFYHDTWIDYSLMGTFVVQTGPGWVSHMVADWVASGWTGSTLAAVQANEINDHLVAFKARYDDQYKDAPTLQSCGWYTAIYVDGNWAFTNYAEIDCGASGL